VPIDQVHVLHQLLVRQVRISLAHSRIVQRDERQPPGTVPPCQPRHLAAAKATLPVKNDHIGIRSVVRIRQFLLPTGGI
jgi:hypothetical protein